MIDTIIVIAIVGAVAAVAFFKFVKPKLDAAKAPAPLAAPSGDMRVSVPPGATIRHDYTPPDASTIKDQASWEAYRNQLAPSTRAFTPEIAYGPDGKPLDSGGREIKPGTDFGPIPEAQCAVPGSISVTYRGSPITLAPVAGKTNMNAGVHAIMFGQDGRTLANVRPGADGGQFHVDAKMGESVLVQLDGPPNVYMVKP